MVCWQPDITCQLVVIGSVDVGFNNCHMSDMTDHLTQCLMASSSDSGVSPTITIASEMCVVPSNTTDIRYILITHEI